MLQDNTHTRRVRARLASSSSSSLVVFSDPPSPPLQIPLFFSVLSLHPRTISAAALTRKEEPKLRTYHSVREVYPLPLFPYVVRQKSPPFPPLPGTNQHDSRRMGRRGSPHLPRSKKTPHGVTPTPRPSLRNEPGSFREGGAFFLKVQLNFMRVDFFRLVFFFHLNFVRVVFGACRSRPFLAPRTQRAAGRDRVLPPSLSRIAAAGCSGTRVGALPCSVCGCVVGMGCVQ